MRTSKKIELPGRFTLPTLAGLKAILDKELSAESGVLLDGSAVTSVDSAALQLILVVQHAVDSQCGRPHDSHNKLSVLHAPSATLVDALQSYGVPGNGAVTSAGN